MDKLRVEIIGRLIVPPPPQPLRCRVRVNGVESEITAPNYTPMRLKLEALGADPYQMRRAFGFYG